MAKKVYDQDGLDMQKIDWSGDKATGGLPVSGRLVEKYIKSIDEKATTTEELEPGETKAPSSSTVFNALVGTVTDIDVTDSEDGTQYVMKVKQKDSEGGETDKEVRFSKYSDDDKVVIHVDLTDGAGSALPASQYLSLGTGFVVKYAVNVGTAGGSEVDGYSDLKARLIVKRGSTVLSDFQDTEFVGVTAGQSYAFDVSKYLTDATTYTVQVEAQATYEGGTLNKTATARVTMVSMSLETTYQVGNGVADGGYRNDVNIPFTVKGTTGEKNIYYRINGGVPFTMAVSSGSGLQSKNINVPLSDLKEGLNVVEAYAMHENSGVMSRAHYISLLKAGDSVTNYAGLMFSHHADGFQADWNKPVLNAEQFTAWNFTYAAYDKFSNIAAVKIESGGNVLKEDLLSRGESGSYGKTNVNVDPLAYTLVCGPAQAVLGVSTSPHSDIEAALSPDAVCSFDAFGRSNTENNAASWVSGDKHMAFKDMLWSVNSNGAGSGWYKDRLLLSNGASMTLTADGGYRPFNEADKPVGYAIRDVGMTLEIEYSTDNVTDTKAELVTCLGRLSNGNRYGLVITPEEAKFLTGVVTEAIDAGEVIRYEDSVGTKFEPGKNIKVTYVFYPITETNEQRTLIGFYVNGEESAASKWVDKVDFDIESQLLFNSTGADLAVKNIRIYNKALTDDEVLNNYIVDRNHLEDTEEEKGVRTLDEDNRVLNEGERVSMEKLMSYMEKRHNSILVLYGSGSVDSEVPSDSDTLNIMDALAQCNDKKANKLCRELRFYNGENRSLDFVLKNAFLRIQGTSSVNYARKNLRIYFQKTAAGWVVTLSYGEIDGNGNQGDPIQTEGKKNLFKLRENSVGAKLACPKCDFSDSSMTTNTGGAKFIHDGLKEMGLLTPAQRYAVDHPATCPDDIRSAVDGMPCDLFVAKSADDDLVYYGQYNMNNEKSDSYPIFGQDETIGGETWGEGDTLDYLETNDEGKKEYLPICIETLNNSNDLCLFHWLPSTDTNHTDFMDNNFDGGFEFNHPKDTFWSNGGGDEKEEPNLKEHLGTGDTYDKMYKAIDRMMSFVNKCAKETEACKDMGYDMSTHTFTGVDYTDDGNQFPAGKWKSDTFRKEAGKYFDLPYLAAYYLYVDFNLGVDQLAKNMLLRTWDGVKWYITYYDGDCQLGSDNKSFLTGLYDDNRQTKRDGAYVMQGHNSWLWNLVLGNFSDLITEIMVTGYNGGSPFMSAFSIQKANDHFDKEQMGKWCSRLYNKSGIFKYIYPFLNPMKVGADGAEQTYPQIYGLKGSLKAHRSYFIRRRYDLKQVEYGYVSTLGAQFYQSTASLDAGYILKPMQFSLTIPYRVQISTSNGVQADSGLVEADTLHTLSLKGSFGENDPLKIIGAGRIKELVWHEDAFSVGFNFGLLTSLVKLDMSVGTASGYRNGSFMTSTNALALLEELNMRNNQLARNGDNGNTATLDLSWQSRLKKLDIRGTGVTRLRLATGAPIVQLHLPGTIEELFLEYLTKLPESGLLLEGISHVTGYRFASCPGIDGFALLERLHSAKKSGTGKLERFSIEIDREDDGTLLAEYYDYGTYTSTGTSDNRHSGFRGTLHLTKYLTDELMVKYHERYPELEIIQPEYTMIEFDDTVSDDANISNLDNETGYKFNNAYRPSAHISTILNARYHCLGKQTEEGVMTVCRLHDSDTNYYADAENTATAMAAKLDSTEGDVWLHEPHYWYKGINDYLNNKKYTCFSSNREKPSCPDCKIITLEEISEIKKNNKIQVGRPDLSSSYVSDTKYNVCRVPVSGYKRVRFPSVVGTLVGSVFVDSNDTILSNVMIESLGNRFADGMYLICDIPEGAESLCFTVRNTVDFDMVVLSNSDKIEDMEPDWVEHEACLVGVYEAVTVGTKLYSAVTGGNSVGSMGKTDFEYYAESRKLQLVDYEMHKDVANLFYAKYGRRDAQGQCGYGTNSYTRAIGLTSKLGMNDTVNPENKTEHNAWYGVVDEDGEIKYVSIASTLCMGYENWYGHKFEWMGKVGLPNTPSSEAYKWHIEMPDGSIRKVKSGETSGYITGVVHQKYCDLIPSFSQPGSSSTHYCDEATVSSATARVEARSYSSANAGGGVAYSYCGHDSSSSGAYNGSRLAFRGRIVVAESVEAYKSLQPIA